MNCIRHGRKRVVGNQILRATIQKIKFCFFKKTDSCYFRLQTSLKQVTRCSSRQKITSHSGRCRHIHTYSSIYKHIQIYSGIFRHNQAYSGIIQSYSEPCVILAYSEHSHIQKPGILRTLSHSELEVHLEPYLTSTMECLSKIVNSYNFFCKL